MEVNKIDSRLFNEMENGDVPEETVLAFKQLLDMSQRGADFIRELYDKYNVLTKFYLDKNKIACKKFCSYCCLQLMPCTSSEMEVITDYIRSLDRTLRRSVIVHLKSRSRKFMVKYYRLEKEGHNSTAISERLRQHYMGVTCPFLGKAGYCVVYPVRPMVCRAMKATRSCGITRSEEGDKNLMVKLIMDEIALNLVRDNDILMNGEAGSSLPLVAWPASRRFYREFF